MADQVIGIAVLDKTEQPASLHVLCQCADGQNRHTSIPVYAPGEQKVREHQWEYRIEGDALHMKPSLHWLGVFHNEGNWTVKFQEFKSGDYLYAGDLFRAINNIQK